MGLRVLGMSGLSPQEFAGFESQTQGILAALTRGSCFALGQAPTSLGSVRISLNPKPQTPNPKP